MDETPAQATERHNREKEAKRVTWENEGFPEFCACLENELAEEELEITEAMKPLFRKVIARLIKRGYITVEDDES